MYLDWKLYEKNVVGYKIAWSDLYYVKFNDELFENSNPEYFSPANNSFVTLSKDEKMERKLKYSIFKNKTKIWAFDSVSIWNFIRDSVEIVDWNSTPCIFDTESSIKNIIICVNKWNYVALTNSLNPDKTLNKKIMIYNWVKLIIPNNLFEQPEESKNLIDEERLKKQQERIKEGIKNNAIKPIKFQPIFNEKWELLWILWKGAILDDSEIWILSTMNKKEVKKYISKKFGIKDEGVLDRIDKGKLTSEEEVKKNEIEEYFDGLSEKINYWVELYKYTWNWIFNPPERVITNITDFYWIVPK